VHITETGEHVFSHTSLSLWRSCPRKWYHRYVLREQEPPGVAAAFSVRLIHQPFAFRFGGQGPDIPWELYESQFQNDIGGQHADAVFKVGTAINVLRSIESLPLWENVSDTEKTRLLSYGKAGYTSRADAIIVHGGRHYTVDIKFHAFSSRYVQPSKTPPIKPLLAFDDQLLGQAICAEADGFVRVTVQACRETGKVYGPIVEEHLVDAQLRGAWMRETEATIHAIMRTLEQGGPWVKNDDTCYRYGVMLPCPYLKECLYGG
jgi:hypothetical protein